MRRGAGHAAVVIAGNDGINVLVRVFPGGFVHKTMINGYKTGVKVKVWNLFFEEERF